MIFDDLPNGFRIAAVNSVDNLASFILSDMLSNAPTTKIRYSTGIREGTRIDGGVVKSVISIDLRIAPEALAYEYGSGIHGEKGQKYPIPGISSDLPVNKKFLAFMWDKADPSKHKILPDGRVLLPKVSHPGVKAKPYINPAINKAKQNLGNLVKKEFMDAIRISLRQS